MLLPGLAECPLEEADTGPIRDVDARQPEVLVVAARLLPGEERPPKLLVALIRHRRTDNAVVVEGKQFGRKWWRRGSPLLPTVTAHERIQAHRIPSRQRPRRPPSAPVDLSH